MVAGHEGGFERGLIARSSPRVTPPPAAARLAQASAEPEAGVSRPSRLERLPAGVAIGHHLHRLGG
eukprot:scaffold4589_cov106-Isochrysis_galbana.AAC.3